MPPVPRPRGDALSDSDLIAAAVEASGLSARRFAELLLARDERTVRYWRSGASPIPPAARAWLAQWLALTDRERAAVIRSLRAA